MSKSVENIKEDILNNFREIKADVGHVFNFRWFNQIYLTGLNPKEKKNVVDAVNQLIESGLVTHEERGGFLMLKLTEAGVDAIY